MGEKLIGRTDELDRLRAAISAVDDGGVLAVITGDAGIGKSALVDEAAAVARADGFLELRCAGTQSEAPSGFAALHELLHPVLGRAAALPPRQRQALLGAFGIEENPAPERLMVNLAVLGLLEELAADRKVVVVVEDLQWLDRSTSDAIAFVARRLGPSRLLMLVTSRGDELDALRSASTLQLALGPLPEDAAARLLDDVAGSLSRPVKDRVLREAAGNPLALTELSRVVADEVPGGSALPEFLPTTRRLERAFLDQVAGLPPASRTLLVLAAVDQALSVDELFAAGQALGAGPEAFDAVERSGVVEVRQGVIRFRHPLMRSVVHGAASTSERRGSHRALSAVIGDPVRSVWHRAAAAFAADEQLAADLETAAADAGLRGAQAEASALFDRAAALSPDPGQRGRRLAASAENARRAGLTREAVRAVERALPLAGNAGVAVQLASTEIVSTLMAGLPLRSETTVPDLLRRLAQGDAEERVVLLWAAAVQLALRPQRSGNRQLLLDELDSVELERRNPLQQIALALLDPEGRAPHLRDQLPTLLPPAVTDPRVLLTVGLAAERMQDLATAQAGLLAGYHHLRGTGGTADEAHLLAWLACARVLTGSVLDGIADAALAERMATDLGLTSVATAAAASGALGHAWRGDAAETARAVERTRSQPADLAWTSTVARSNWAVGVLALQQRRFRDAWIVLNDLSMDPTTRLWALGDLAEAAVRSGKTAETAEVVAVAEKEAAAFGSAHLWMLVHRSHAVLGGDDPAERFEAAVEQAQDCPAVLEVARTRLAYGEWLRRERRIAAAREQLAAAHHLFDRCGARLWTERAAAELRAAGVTPAGVREPCGDVSFTPQEFQIMRLAAAGLTNKEIADQIYLSHRTVAAHLYKVFPKLGITSRGQLVEALSRLSDESPS
ncbi:helix-turn-helix transcriptional regulator [Kribbella sp. ALI-6-A]|uniref:helix-turn-helix transcriptional regulator n=1 Tax=Kribbella sp. ALI-6-A TaxID=1933817 RepID=UPI0009FDF473|nr:LuxR family transcriptional regulator [Kribbella sp. ALI-6-A]